MRVNGCTDVSVADANGDGYPDVAFSNRNDIEDAFWCFQQNQLLPQTFDHLFFNESTAGGFAFSPCVELLGSPNDGTGYGEFVQLNPSSHWSASDARPDWLDANFSNTTTTDAEKNRMWWGHHLVSVGCPQLGTPNPGTPQIPARLNLSTEPGNGGAVWVAFGSYSGFCPGCMIGGEEVPIVYDALFQFMYDHWSQGTPFGQMISGVVASPEDTDIAFDFTASVSNSLAGLTNDLYYTVIYFYADGSFTAANAVRSPLALP